MDDSRTLTKRGVAAVVGIAGGAALLVLNALPAVFCVAAGALVTVFGLAAAFSGDGEDKQGGAVMTAAGVTALLSRIAPLGFVKAIAATALSISSFALIGFGLWNGLKFLRGLKDLRRGD